MSHYNDMNVMVHICELMILIYYIIIFALITLQIKLIDVNI